MKQLPILVFLALAACSTEPATTPQAPAPAAEKAPLPPVDEVALLPRKKPSPSPERVMAARPKPKPAKDEEPAEIHLPAFTFRTMDHQSAKVELNGEPLSTTPCLWSISRNLKGDEKITLDGQWPPTGGRFIATTKSPDDPESKADLYVIDKPELLEKIGVGRAGECVLVVRGTINRIPLRAALRLRVYNYRFTDFAPLDNPEGDNASRFLRTLWFERIDDR